MTNDQPTQPLTDAELARIREHLASDNVALHDAWLADDALHLLAAVDRLRAELDEQRWYGEQLQSSIDACSGTHLPIEDYAEGA